MIYTVFNFEVIMSSTFQTGTRYCGQHYYDANDTDWNLLGTNGVRTWSKTITYPTAFSVTPTGVQVFVSGFHVLNGFSPKFTLSVSTVTTTSFLLSINTFDDCQIVGVTVGWFAVTI
jgi:hypothetical protein